MLLFFDASRYPNDAAGASQDNIYLFMHAMKVAIDEDDPILNNVVHAIHERVILFCPFFLLRITFQILRLVGMLRFPQC